MQGPSQQFGSALQIPLLSYSLVRSLFVCKIPFECQLLRERKLNFEVVFVFELGLKVQMEGKWIWLLLICKVLSLENLLVSGYECGRFNFTHVKSEVVELAYAKPTPGMAHKMKTFRNRQNSSSQRWNPNDNKDDTCQEKAYEMIAEENMVGWAKCESILWAKNSRATQQDQFYADCGERFSQIHSDWKREFLREMNVNCPRPTMPTCPTCPTCPRVDTSAVLRAVKTELLASWSSYRQALYQEMDQYVLSLLWSLSTDDTALRQALDILLGRTNPAPAVGGVATQNELNSIATTLRVQSQNLQVLHNLTEILREEARNATRSQAMIMGGQAVEGLLMQAMMKEYSQMQSGLSVFATTFQHMWESTIDGASWTNTCPELDTSAISFGSDYGRPLDAELAVLINRTEEEMPEDLGQFTDDINRFVHSWFYVSDSCNLFGPSLAHATLVNDSSLQTEMCSLCSTFESFQTIHTNGSNLSILLWCVHAFGHIFTACSVFFLTSTYYRKQLTALNNSESFSLSS